MPHRVGIDLVRVSNVRDALAEHGERYVRRIYTEREVADCMTDGAADPLLLASRFAAKEAAMKALRIGDRAVPWRSIELVRAPGGHAELVLHDRAREIADEQGIDTLEVSITHEDDYAAAVVAADIERAGVQDHAPDHR